MNKTTEELSMAATASLSQKLLGNILAPFNFLVTFTIWSNF